MPQTLMTFVVFMFATTLSQLAVASALEETFPVLQYSSGTSETLIQLGYSSDEKDERAGIRRHDAHYPDGKKRTRCSYREDPKMVEAHKRGDYDYRPRQHLQKITMPLG
ncbi:MAG: hypothetical protein LBU46_08185 [Candidatus Accumulibacter sp.]|jgi:hypothetical protein|nr:hypothetical protein [Accumulibacter sp.]